MAIGVLSILRLKVFQRLLGQQVLNVTHFQVVGFNGDPNSLQGFAQAAGEDFYQSMSVFQNAGLVYVNATLEEVNGVVFDEYSFPAGRVGNRTGEALPPFNAVGVKLTRQSKVTRNGAARIAGLSEPDVFGTGYTTAYLGLVVGQVSDYYPAERFWEDPSPTGFSMTANPIIWGGNSPAFPVGRFSDITGVTVNANVTTQNTRKVRTNAGL